jgi:site-specific recombinase XerD
MTAEKLVKTFLDWNQQQARNRLRSAATVRFYASRLKAFAEYFNGRKWKSIRPLEVNEYLDHAGQGLSDSTRRHNVVALQTLQAFALKEKLEKRRIFEKLEKPRMGQRERVATEDEVDRILAGASVEFRLIFAALGQTGCRPGELCGLQIDQIDWDKGEHGLIVIQNHKTARKTGRPRIIPIGWKFAALLRMVIGERTSGAVFLSQAGRPWSPAHLSGMHRRLRDAAGLDRQLVLYSRRHGFATNLIKNGVDINTVCDLMGHSSLDMTKRYAHRDYGTLGGAQDKI